MKFLHFLMQASLWWGLILVIPLCLNYGLQKHLFDAYAIVGLFKFTCFFYCLKSFFDAMGRFGLSNKEMLRKVSSSLMTWNWQKQCAALRGLSLVLGDRFGQGSISSRRHQRSCSLWATWLQIHCENLFWDAALQRYVERDLSATGNTNQRAS